MSANLTIVVLAYNSAHIIGECLNKLNFEKYKVVVVDNASKDNALEFVRKNFPQAEIIALPKNIGYGNGNNAALKLVATDFALVLNPDAMILEKDIETVLSVMRNDASIAMTGPIILDEYPANKNEVEKKISRSESDLTKAEGNYYEKIDGNFAARFLSGAALFMKISIMKKIGFFDEKIFLYYEDDEICARVRNNGYKNIIVTNALAFHVSGGGKSSGSSLKVIYKKNWHLVWSKLYWKKLRKGILGAKRSAFKLSIVYLIKALFCALTFNREKLVLNLGSSAGAFSFFIGLEAFDKNGNSRG